MHPTKFDGYNTELTKPKQMTDEQCSSMFVFRDGIQCISSWKVPFLERLKILLFGRVWVGVINGRTQPPIYLTPDKPEMKNGLHIIKKDSDNGSE